MMYHLPLGEWVFILVPWLSALNRDDTSPIKMTEVNELEKERTGFRKDGLKYFLAVIGPGFILASTTIGPGSIVSATNAGANYGYTLFWWFIVMLVFRAVFSLAMNRYTVVTGRPLMVGIREKYGKVVALLAGIFAFVGQCIYGIGNFMGCGLGISMLFPGIPVKVGGVIALILCVALYFLKGLYRKIENVMKVLVVVMAAIFAVSLIGTIGIPYDGTVSHSLVGMPSGSMAIMLSLLGTTASLGTCAWGSSLAKEKGYTSEDIDHGGLRTDVVVGVIAIGVISVCCFFVGANLLPGQPISNGMDLLNALSGLLGNFIRPIFGIGFLAAAISSLMMAPKLGINLLLQAMDKDSGMENKTENYISILMLVFGMVIALLYGGAPAQLMTLAQIGGVINTPILGIMTILLCNRKDEMGRYKIGKGFTVALTISYVFIMITVINNLITIIQGIFA